MVINCFNKTGQPQPPSIHWDEDFAYNSASASAGDYLSAAEWKAKLAGKNVKFISYHPDFQYFAERFGLTHVGTIQPKPGIEPTSVSTPSTRYLMARPVGPVSR